MLGGTLFVVSLILNTLFLLLFAVEHITGSDAVILFKFNVEKHPLYLGFIYATIVDLFYCLFWGS